VLQQALRYQVGRMKCVIGVVCKRWRDWGTPGRSSAYICSWWVGKSYSVIFSCKLLHSVSRCTKHAAKGFAHWTHLENMVRNKKQETREQEKRKNVGTGGWAKIDRSNRSNHPYHHYRVEHRE
jgi:hypothetical protein